MPGLGVGDGDEPAAQGLPLAAAVQARGRGEGCDVTTPDDRTPDEEHAAAAPEPDGPRPDAVETATAAHAEAQDGDAEDDDPDIGFTLAEDPAELAERAKQLCHRIARGLAAQGPQGWARLDAVFTLTTTTEMVQVFFSDEQRRAVRVQPAPDVLALVRDHRRLSAELGDGPWWRLLLTLHNDGAIEVDFDYGDEPFPDDQLFPPEVYAADLQTYPRASLPVWLAAYVRHGGRQSRPAHVAAAQARADRAAQVRPVRSDTDFPALPVMWGRWAVMAAAFVAAGSQWGPRILPALGFFEGARRSGATLYMVPGGRAVLSGGVWNAPELDAAYNGGADLPRVYSGAPEWVANPVLNPRAGNGLLTFCYWWEAGSWYRGESPAATALADAVPGIWTTDTVVDVVCGLLAEQPTEAQRAAVATLVAAAEVGVVTRDTLVEVFGEGGDFDVDSAFYQLTMAGVAVTVPEPMPQEDAVAKVRRFIVERGMDAAGYPVEDLRAERISVGWMVYAPARELAVGRAVFYIADDGVLEQSSSSVAPSVFVAEFERRFQQRHGAVGA
ncbi:hypothetical protein IU444_21755 [Nocardia farcinica]|nr:hypothetical protein [Nocardia farcinica]MBF6386757.1 hypothetical protein [Nocardia farcinica]MBF6443611.1 hypothetical protein [Nocardia farcinica]MBF6523956.1 hypothetical protein [Nocardia farcinica]